MNSGIGRERQERSHRGRSWVSVVAGTLRGLADLRSMIGGKALEQRLKALHVAGCPMSFADLEARSKLPEEAPNAAAVYERAFAAFVPSADEENVPLLGRAELPERGVSLPEPMAEAIADCLASNGQCLSLLREAADIEDCWYRRDLKELLPNSLGLRRCTILLRLNTLFQGHQNDSDGVMSSVRSALRLAESLRRGPLMITYAVRMAQYGAALKGLEWALSATDFADRQLGELDDMLGASGRTLDLGEVMMGERSYMIETYNAPPGPHSFMFDSPLLKLACVRRLGLSDNLDYMADVIEASCLPGRQRLARFRVMEKKAEGLSFVHVVIKVIAPLTTRIIEIDVRLQAHLTLARTALAIERYRLATGTPPEQLDELVPTYLTEVPIDPFDGQPIRYRPSASGYLLYSVDADGQDNGGRERKDVNPGEPYDLCFIVAR